MRMWCMDLSYTKSLSGWKAKKCSADLDNKLGLLLSVVLANKTDFISFNWSVLHLYSSSFALSYSFYLALCSVLYWMLNRTAPVIVLQPVHWTPLLSVCKCVSPVNSIMDAGPCISLLVFVEGRLEETEGRVKEWSGGGVSPDMTWCEAAVLPIWNSFFPVALHRKLNWEGYWITAVQSLKINWLHPRF